MTTDDVAPAERVTAIGFHELDTRMFRRAWPDPQLRPPARSAHWIRRTQHLLGTDPGGCWVAERDEELLGVVVSFVREKMWLLASYAVVPGAQGLGLGRALLAPALDHGRGSLRAMLNASNDPKAVRRYHEAGFRLYPQMFLRGTPDRSTIPVVEKVREGSAGDVDLMDSIDRQTRGAAHGVDHEILLEQYRLVVSDTTTPSRSVPSSATQQPPGSVLSRCCVRRTHVALRSGGRSCGSGQERRNIRVSSSWNPIAVTRSARATSSGVIGRIRTSLTGST